MRTRYLAIAIATLSAAAVAPATIVGGAATEDEVASLCEELWSTYADTPTAEPLAGCQWNMAMIGANDATFTRATGEGVRVGVIDSGVDMTHPDIAPNLDVAASCSFITFDDPLALDVEKAGGDCSNKDAVQDYGDHGTHVASTIAAPINGIGIAGVAPKATIVALKACSASGYCFADAVAAALRYAGDQRLDVVNMSLFADPYLYYCGNDAAQRTILRTLQQAARYAQQRGVLIVAAAGNEASDLRHPGIDAISPDYPPESAIVREVKNNCRVAPTELAGVVSVMSTGPIGYEGYDLNIATYSTVGGDVAAPGGDYFEATDTVQDAILAAASSTSDPEFGTYDFYDFLEAAIPLPGLTVESGGARYVYLNGTSMASPHAAGVAALIIQQHPEWTQGAVAAALERSATPQPCPADWAPLGPNDERAKCYGGNGRTSFFGHGVVSASAATS